MEHLLRDITDAGHYGSLSAQIEGQMSSLQVRCSRPDTSLLARRLTCMSCVVASSCVPVQLPCCQLANITRHSWRQSILLNCVSPSKNRIFSVMHVLCNAAFH